jgi:hypothetical protein
MKMALRDLVYVEFGRRWTRLKKQASFFAPERKENSAGEKREAWQLTRK